MTTARAPCKTQSMPMLAPATWNSGMATSTASPGSNLAHCGVAEFEQGLVVGLR